MGIGDIRAHTARPKWRVLLFEKHSKEFKWPEAVSARAQADGPERLTA